MLWPSRLLKKCLQQQQGLLRLVLAISWPGCCLAADDDEQCRLLNKTLRAQLDWASGPPCPLSSVTIMRFCIASHSHSPCLAGQPQALQRITSHQQTRLGTPLWSSTQTCAIQSPFQADFKPHYSNCKVLSLYFQEALEAIAYKNHSKRLKTIKTCFFFGWMHMGSNGDLWLSQHCCNRNINSVFSVFHVLSNLYFKKKKMTC